MLLLSVAMLPEREFDGDVNSQSSGSPEFIILSLKVWYKLCEYVDVEYYENVRVRQNLAFLLKMGWLRYHVSHPDNKRFYTVYYIHKTA